MGRRRPSRVCCRAREKEGNDTPIDYAGDKVEVGTTDVVIDQTRDLVVRKMGKTVETIVGAVDDVEEFFAFTALYKVKNTVFAYLQVIALLYQLCRKRKLAGRHLRHLYPAFYPVVVFAESKLIHETGIVLIIIINI